MWKKVIKSSYKRRTHVIVRHGKEKQANSRDDKTNEDVDKDNINVRDDECSNSNDELEYEANSEKTSVNITSVSDTPKKVRKLDSANKNERLRRSQSMVSSISRQNSIIEVGKCFF